MTYTAYDGIFSSAGWLTFWIILFAILALASLTWFFLYIEQSQNRNWKTTTLIVIITALLVTFEIQLLLFRANVVFT